MNDSVCRRSLLIRALLVCVIAMPVASCVTNDTKPTITPPIVPEHVSTAPIVEEKPGPVAVMPVVEPQIKPEPELVIPVAPMVETPSAGKQAVAEEPLKVTEEVVPVVVQDIPPNTFLVKVAPKNTKHLFYGVGSQVGMVINGEQGKELVVVRGQTYTFKVDTGVRHDFYLSRSAKGWGAATLTSGVKGNFTYKGVVTFTPGKDTPSVVYYQCRNHKNMGSKIHVVDKGGENKVVFGVRGGAKPGSKKSTKQSAFTSGNQAKQKVMFAEMFIAMSPAAKRIDASDHAEAKQMLNDARTQLDEAKKSLAKGNNEQAIAIVDEALRSMTAASQRVPSQSELSELRADFDELLTGAHTYEKSYRRNYKMMKKKGKKNLPNLNIEQVSKMIADAEKLAANNEFVEANKQLSIVQRSITGALTQLLADETMDYTLSFDNPQEEYEYELSRYKSFNELVPIAIEQKKPAKQTRALMAMYVDKAKDIYGLSEPKAKSGDYKTAIQMLQGATSNLQRALRIIGVR